MGSHEERVQRLCLPGVISCGPRLERCIMQYGVGTSLSTQTANVLFVPVDHAVVGLLDLGGRQRAHLERLHLLLADRHAPLRGATGITRVARVRMATEVRGSVSGKATVLHGHNVNQNQMNTMNHGKCAQSVS